MLNLQSFLLYGKSLCVTRQILQEANLNAISDLEGRSHSERCISASRAKCEMSLTLGSETASTVPSEIVGGLLQNRGVQRRPAATPGLLTRVVKRDRVKPGQKAAFSKHLQGSFLGVRGSVAGGVAFQMDQKPR